MIKKNYCYSLLSFVLTASVFVAMQSCKKPYLEKTTTTDLTEQSVFSDSARTMDFLAQIYSNIDFSFSPVRFNSKAGLEACADEAEGPEASFVTTYNQFATGSIGAATISWDAWGTPYSNIRAVNQLLKHLPFAPIVASIKQRIKGEALFLRAWYYSLLIKHYGGVPLVGDTVFTLQDKILANRKTYEECVNYILEQCDAAAAILPLEFSGGDFGRVTKAACLALKAKVLLYAASPLFNGQGIAGAEPLKSITGYPAADVNRWKKAADAAKAVMDLNLFALHHDATKPGYGFYKVFQLRKNKEYIFQSMKDPESSFQDLELYWRPPSRGGNTATGSWAYQNLVAAFQMNNGKDITDPSSGYNPSDPYANRDPRLDYTITRNGSLIFDRSTMNQQPVYTYFGEPKGDGWGQGTPTGYYINKMCNDDVTPYYYNKTQRCYPLIRYADILLMYAEAINEFSGPSEAAYDAVDSVRKRAGLNPFAIQRGLSQAQLRAIIQHERQVELAFEESRFWDVRRWKIAEQTDSKMMTGMRITPTGASYNHEVANVRQHNFRPAMYLWPIPQSETGKSSELLQNPGY